MPFLSFAATLDPIIVSSKTETSQSQLTYEPDVITEEEIEGRFSTSLVDQLRLNHGLNISQTGGPSGNYSISIRGAESRHTLVLIDGIKVNDPSESTNSFNMPGLSSLDIEKVEIIKGAQSLLYGADAIGGVINIITKKGEKGGRVSLETGVRNEFSNSVTVYTRRGALYLNTFYNESEKISALKSNGEQDKAHNKGVTLNYSLALEKAEFDWKLKLLDSFNEFDNSAGDSTLPFARLRTQLYSQTVKLNKHKIQSSYLRTDRFSDFGTSFNTYKGENLTNEYIFNVSSDSIKAAFGVQHEYITYEQQNTDQYKANMISIYGSYSLYSGDYIFNKGLRASKHEEFGNSFNYNLGVVRKLTGIYQLKLNYATGFKNPTLYQLYTIDKTSFGTTAGNKNLKPEVSGTKELTFSKKGRNPYSVTLFETRITDFINYKTDSVTFDSTFINSKSLRTYGVDFKFLQSFKNTNLSEGIIFLRSEDSARKNALKKPGQKLTLNIAHKVDDTHSVVADWYWVSAQYDYGDIELPAYDVTSLSYVFKKQKYLLKAGIRNVFDKRYEEAAGYNVLGLNGYFKAEYFY